MLKSPPSKVEKNLEYFHPRTLYLSFDGMKWWRSDSLSVSKNLNERDWIDKSMNKFSFQHNFVAFIVSSLIFVAIEKLFIYLSKWQNGKEFLARKVEKRSGVLIWGNFYILAKFHNVNVIQRWQSFLHFYSSGKRDLELFNELSGSPHFWSRVSAFQRCWTKSLFLHLSLSDCLPFVFFAATKEKLNY